MVVQNSRFFQTTSSQSACRCIRSLKMSSSRNTTSPDGATPKTWNDRMCCWRPSWSGLKLRRVRSKSTRWPGRRARRSKSRSTTSKSALGGRIWWTVVRGTPAARWCGCRRCGTSPGTCCLGWFRSESKTVAWLISPGFTFAWEATSGGLCRIWRLDINCNKTQFLWKPICNLFNCYKAGSTGCAWFWRSAYPAGSTASSGPHRQCPWKQKHSVVIVASPIAHLLELVVILGAVHRPQLGVVPQMV